MNVYQHLRGQVCRERLAGLGLSSASRAADRGQMEVEPARLREARGSLGLARQCGKFRTCQGGDRHPSLAWVSACPLLLRRRRREMMRERTTGAKGSAREVEQRLACGGNIRCASYVGGDGIACNPYFFVQSGLDQQSWQCRASFKV